MANQRRGVGASDQSEAGYLGNCMSITPRVMTLGHSPLTRYDERRGEYSARTQITNFVYNKHYFLEGYYVLAYDFRTRRLGGCGLGFTYLIRLIVKIYCFLWIFLK